LLGEGRFLDTKTLALDDRGSDTSAALLVLNPRQVLAVYTRTVYDPPYAGARRGFARVLTIGRP
jgi:hypothetical protein